MTCISQSPTHTHTYITKMSCINEVEEFQMYLTRYELSRLLGTRAKQISSGGSICIPKTQAFDLDPLEIAELELKIGKIPGLMIKRKYPNKQVKYLDPNKMNNSHLLAT